MLELNADLWTVECDIRCITTNGTVHHGRNVMGGGCARQAAERQPRLPAIYGQIIERHGNHVWLLEVEGHDLPEPLVMFPVKRRVEDRADPDLIFQSAEELVALTNVQGWHRVALPQPGCGLGGLSWNTDIRPLLTPILDDRFLIIDYPKEAATP